MASSWSFLWQMWPPNLLPQETSKNGKTLRSSTASISHLSAP